MVDEDEFSRRETIWLQWVRHGSRAGSACGGSDPLLNISLRLRIAEEQKSSGVVVSYLQMRRPKMHEIIYLVGLVVVIMFVLSLLGLR